MTSRTLFKNLFGVKDRNDAGTLQAATEAAKPKSNPQGAKPAAKPGAKPERLYTIRFETPEELARYTRLDALSQPLLLAHRAGYSPEGKWPECALQSADRVLRTGPAIIELDVRTTTDGELVCLHDKTLDKGTTGKGPVKEKTLAEIRKLRLRDAQGLSTEYRAPTLDEFLAWSAGGAILWLDLKDAAPEAVIAKIREQGAEARVIVSAYGRKKLKAFMKLAPDLVYFVPFAAELNLPDLTSALNLGLRPDQMIGFAGLYIPDFRTAQELAAHNIPALLDLGRGDRRLAAKQLDVRLYSAAIREGFPLINTDQYRSVLQMLGIRDWAKQPEPTAV